MKEGQNIEKKSIRKIRTDRKRQLKELSKTCVAFANKDGGELLIGIEDTENEPPIGQKVSESEIEKLYQSLRELCHNVYLQSQKKTADNGSEYIQIKVFPSNRTIASTSRGEYYIRVGDQSQPLLPEELSRLLTDKPSYQWETTQTKFQLKTDTDIAKLNELINSLRTSSFVRDSVKQKTDTEILLHYSLITPENYLTHLGVLWIGNQHARSNLSYAPILMYLKYDTNQNKVGKIKWDDYTLNPKELINDVWNLIHELREGIEITDGMFRKTVRNYEEEVVRELLVNALVHKPYNIGGVIRIELHPNKLIIANPGPLPYGVSVDNILHQSQRRNEKLVRLVSDIGLMEGEGSGIDKVYETLVKNGKQLPTFEDHLDEVVVTIYKRIIDENLVKFISNITGQFDLTQKEKITLGIIAQEGAARSIDLTHKLRLPSGEKQLRHWIGRLVDMNILITRGTTKSYEYMINPEMLTSNTVLRPTTLRTLQPPAIEALIMEDLRLNKASGLTEILERLKHTGVTRHQLQGGLRRLREQEKVQLVGIKRGSKYQLI